jgi:TolA-binding protein
MQNMKIRKARFSAVSKSEYLCFWRPTLTFLFMVVIEMLVIARCGNAQISEEQILKMLEQYDLQTARQKIEDIYRQRPSSAPAAYWRALITEDAAEAAELFDEVVLRFRNSEYADRATYRIAQFHFARGQYHSAQKYFSDVARRFPQSSLRGPARYFAAKSWLAAGEIDSAYADLLACADAGPETWFGKLAKEDLDGLSAGDLQKTLAAATKFTVQVGAYSKRDNAVKQAERLKGLNYAAEIYEKRQKEKLHLVWVGNFSTREEAARLSDELRRKLGGLVQVVIREP